MKKSIQASLVSIGSILNQFPDHICMINPEGEIVFVNNAWRDFAIENGATNSSFVGTNYFESGQTDEENVKNFLDGIKEVLSGSDKVGTIEVDYPCHSPTQKRWFKAKAKKVLIEERVYGIIIHENQTTKVSLSIEIDLLLEVADIMNRAEGFHEASRKVIQLLCDTSQWVLGEMWIPKSDTIHLYYSGACYCTQQSLNSFCEAADGIKFKRGIGIPGMVWKTKEPIWIENLSASKDFQRAKIANELGINSALGIPIQFENTLYGVFVLYHIGARKSDEHLLELMTSVGKYLGLLYSQMSLKKDLGKERDFFRSIVNDQTEMIVRRGSDGVLTFINDAYRKIFGLGTEDLIGKNYTDLIPPEKVKTIEQKLRRLSPENPVITQVHKVILPGGTTAWQLWTDRAFFDENGEPLEYQSVGRDITEQKENISQKQLALDRLAAISDNLPGVVFRYKLNPDFSDEILFVSDGSKKMWGFTSEEAMADNSKIWSQIHPEDIYAVKDSIRESHENLTTWYSEWRNILADGRVQWHAGKGTPKRLEDGSVIWDSIILDITPQVRLKQELEESEERYRNVFNQQFQFSALLDLEGRILHINDLPLKVQGVSKEAFLGGYFWDAPGFRGNKQRQQKIRDQLIRLKNGEEPLIVEDHYSDLAGETRYTISHYSFVRSTKGELENILVQAMDVTNEKLAVEKIARREQLISMIYENSNDYIILWRVEPTGFYLEELNAKSLELFDLFGVKTSKAEVIGTSAESVFKNLLKVPELSNSKRLAMYEDVKSSNEMMTFDHEFESENGLIVTNESIIPITHENEVTHLLVVARDVTESYLSKKRIVESEKRLSLIYNSSTDFMLLIRIDESGYFIESVNESTVKGLRDTGADINAESIEGLNILEYFEKILHYDRDQIQDHLEVYKKVEQSNKSSRYITESNYNGVYFATETTATPIVESGEVRYILTVSHDITKMVQSKINLELALKEVRKLKEQFEKENIYLKEEISQAHDYNHMVFVSREFREVLNQVEDVANTSATVLITGETGTGKELIARAIHHNSNRREKPMIKVNMAAIPRDLIESELFGYEKGAFTGAVGEKPGKFELADGGTIFLDEIGDMPLDLQVKILRVLQEEEIERLGGTKIRKIDIRVIAATNKDLGKAVKEREFREDLYFRINVFPIHLPPLRSRSEDIPILVEHFIAKYAVKHGKQIEVIPKAVMNYLMNYAWPGNVRELENTVERAVILSRSQRLTIPEVKMASGTDEEAWISGESLDEVQEQHIRKVLIKCNWKIEGKGGAAERLQINPSTLRDKMKSLNISRPQ
ncbi:sigma 54-interacting transcriptional regulator [Marinoscillum sp.]|uniref:sigma 54-interacting transcriptional regulator n=1 Tax=Marinoscillum sp. TaxID=2024838 RepID=UPI003BAA7063